MYKVYFSKKAKKQFSNLDKPIRIQIEKFLFDLEHIDPRTIGKPLKGQWQGCWRYRVNDYRIITEIIDDKLIIEIIKIGHRSKIYNT